MASTGGSHVMAAEELVAWAMRLRTGSDTNNDKQQQLLEKGQSIKKKVTTLQTMYRGGGKN